MVRALTSQEEEIMREKLGSLRLSEKYWRFIKLAWVDVDENPICTACGRKFKNRAGFKIHRGRTEACWGALSDLALHDFYLAKRLGIIKEV